MSYKKQNHNKPDRPYRRQEDTERKTRQDQEIIKLQTTIAYLTRDIRDLKECYYQLRQFALESIWFDRDLVARLGKSYLPAPPCIGDSPLAKEEDNEQ